MDNFYINFVEKVSQDGFFKTTFYRLICKWFGHKWRPLFKIKSTSHSTRKASGITEEDEKNTLFVCRCGEQIDFDQHKSLIRDEKLSKILK